MIVAGAALAAFAVPARAQQPTVVGLWQKVEDGKPVGWFLFVERERRVMKVPSRKLFRAPGKIRIRSAATAPTTARMPMLGLSLVRGMKRAGSKYEDGNIVDPRDGKIYRAIMTLSPDGQTLTLRGYLGIPLLGMDEVWKRLPDDAYAQVDQAGGRKIHAGKGGGAEGQRQEQKYTALNADAADWERRRIGDVSTCRRVLILPAGISAGRPHRRRRASHNADADRSNGRSSRSCR